MLCKSVCTKSTIAAGPLRT